MKVVGENALEKLIKLIKAKFESLAKVATSGSYNDLSDKPTIPSVGNGKITVKQGGITKGTFTVNQTGATTIELTDNDTHYASGTVVTNDATKTGNYGAALTNGNVYLNHVENGAVKNSHKITGSGATTVTSDASGNIIITSTDKDTTYTSLPNPNGLRVQVNGDGASEVRYDGSEAKTINFVAGDNVTLTQKTSENKVTIAAKDTTYSAGTGLSLSGTTFNHSNSVTAGTAQGDASKTLTFGGTFTVPTVTYDAQGHVTGKGTTTMTMPANPNTDTKNTAGSTDTSSKIFLIGAKSQAANPQTYSHDTAYVGTDGCLYSGGTKVSVDGHTHSDYVKKSGSEVSSLNAITAETSTTSVIIPNATAIASSPFARDFWHDHFAFLRGGTSIINNQVSTDGTTWTDDDSDLTPLFIQKETHGITILSTSQLAHRFTIYGDNIKYSYITWFEIGVSYTSPFSSFEVHIESSSDNSSWSTAHKSIVSANSDPVFLKQNVHLSSDGYLRFTFTKTTNITTGSVNISCLKAFTSRKGNQGLGIDYEYPYDWNSNMDIYPVTDNKSTLGTSGRRWANVYATKFTGALTGNAGTATKWQTARKFNGMTVDGTADRTNYGTCSTAADTAAKTVDCTGFKLVTGAEITVKFTVTNKATKPTLNVNGEGARPIFYRGSSIAVGYLAAGRVYTFRYDGAHYELVGDVNTDSDTKVSQEVTTVNAEYPLLLGPNGQTTNVTTTTYFDSGVTLNPSTNTITANISGSAAKVANALTVKANGTSLYTYDGSAAKTINIKAGSNITITSDSSGNITISSTASAGSVTGDVGTVVYEATSGGLYCDGSTANTRDNSKTIEDSSFKYKRLRFYCQGYYGLICTDMPLDREHPTYATGGETGKHYGGVIFPTAENGNINNTGIGPSNHMYYELKWRVTKESAGWRVRVVDSGWLGLNAGKTTNDEYTGNASTSNAGTGYVSWNQRHNNAYCIYKIVAYTD